MKCTTSARGSSRQWCRTRLIHHVPVYSCDTHYSQSAAHMIRSYPIQGESLQGITQGEKSWTASHCKALRRERRAGLRVTARHYAGREELDCESLVRLSCQSMTQLLALNQCCSLFNNIQWVVLLRSSMQNVHMARVLYVPYYCHLTFQNRLRHQTTLHHSCHTPKAP